jgi:myo-inositol-1(or 4)-monophosphatase
MKHDKLESIISIALRAGNFIRLHYERGDFGVSEKMDSHDLVTNIDNESQKIIQEELKARFPNISIIGEEDKTFSKKDHAFIIDPIDGTLNFVKKIPLFSVSIGYWKDNLPLCGVVYDPLRNDIFYARKKYGAYLNGKRLQLSENNSNDYKVLASDWGHEPSLYNKNILAMQQLTKENSFLFRFLGCASLAICYVAAGILDGYWHYKLSPWDMAAAALIAQESGASILSLDGSEFDLWGDSILAVPVELKEKVLEAFKQVN